MRTHNPDECSDEEKVRRGCSRPLKEPHLWDYDSITRTRPSTGACVECTCPIDSHKYETLYTQGSMLADQLAKGLVGLDEISLWWYYIARIVENIEATQWQSTKKPQ